jgi:hypothetical protein
MALAASGIIPGRSLVYTVKHQLDQRPINLMTRSLLPAARSAHASPMMVANVSSNRFWLDPSDGQRS